MDEAERGRGTETKKEKEKEMQKWIKGMDIKKGGEADTGHSIRNVHYWVDKTNCKIKGKWFYSKFQSIFFFLFLHGNLKKQGRIHGSSDFISSFLGIRTK